MPNIKLTYSAGNVFTDMGFSKEQAKNLKFRSTLMTVIVKYIKEKSLTQKQAAKIFDVSQPRVCNLMQGKIDLFSTDTLLNMLDRAGFPIYKKMQVDINSFLKSSFYKNHHHLSTPI